MFLHFGCTRNKKKFGGHPFFVQTGNSTNLGIKSGACSQTRQQQQRMCDNKVEEERLAAGH